MLHEYTLEFGMYHIYSIHGPHTNDWNEIYYIMIIILKKIHQICNTID